LIFLFININKINS